MATQAEINKLAMNFHNVLFDFGIKGLRGDFKDVPKTEFSYGQMTNFIHNVLPGIATPEYDYKYYTTSWDTYQELNDLLLLDKIIYISEKYDCKVPEDLAWTYGLFFADGSCGLNKNGSYSGAFWRIVNSNKEYLERAKIALDWEYKDGLTFIIKEYPDYQKGQKTNYGERKQTLYCLEATSKKFKKRHKNHNLMKPNARGEFIREWRELFYAPISNLKMIPKPIFDKYPEPKKAFLEGLIAGDGSKRKPFYISLDVKNKLAASELYCLMWALNWKFRIEKLLNEFRVYYNKSNLINPPEPLVIACDNFAFLNSSLTALLTGLTGCGAAYGTVYNAGTGAKIALHYFNVIVASDGKCYCYEPMTDGFCQIEKDKKIIIGTWEYRITRVTFF